MFGPRWSEGKGLSGVSPKEVRLEEDDASALRTICCIFHHRNDTVPDILPPEVVLQIAIEADKYDLTVALKYVWLVWLQPRGDASMMDMGYLMAAAFLLGHREMFPTHTLRLILRYKGSYVELLDNPAINQVISPKAICTWLS